MQRRFGVRNVLAETSAAPRKDVPRSRRVPEIYICSLNGGDVLGRTSEHHEINTYFREEFDSVVRELMFDRLRKMYGVK